MEEKSCMKPCRCPQNEKSACSGYIANGQKPSSHVKMNGMLETNEEMKDD